MNLNGIILDYDLLELENEIDVIEKCIIQLYMASSLYKMDKQQNSILYLIMHKKELEEKYEETLERKYNNLHLNLLSYNRI